MRDNKWCSRAAAALYNTLNVWVDRTWPDQGVYCSARSAERIAQTNRIPVEVYSKSAALIIVADCRLLLNADTDKKLSYRRETARPLPVPHGGGGLGPPAHAPAAPSGYTMVESKTRNKRMSSVPSTKRTLRWIGHSRSVEEKGRFYDIRVFVLLYEVNLVMVL